jgi:hypothetical protein
MRLILEPELLPTPASLDEVLLRNQLFIHFHSVTNGTLQISKPQIPLAPQPVSKQPASGRLFRWHPLLRRVGLICLLPRKLIRPILTSPLKKYKVAVKAALATGCDFSDWQGTVATSITNRIACDACAV